MQSFVLRAASTCVFCNPLKGVVFKSVLTSLAFNIFYHIMSIGCTVVLHKERQLIYHSSLVCHHSYMHELLSGLVHVEKWTRKIFLLRCTVSCCVLFMFSYGDLFFTQLICCSFTAEPERSLGVLLVTSLSIFALFLSQAGLHPQIHTH